jgi:hypothetical protein
MTATYEKIATSTLGSTSNGVTFSSITASYTDLVLVFNGAGNADINVDLRFNSDSGSNYSNTAMGSQGTSAASTRNSSQTAMRMNYQGYLRNAFTSLAIINIMNYSNTTTYKTVLNRYNNGNTGVDANVGLWRSTSAITAVEIKVTDGNTFSVGSVFTLYGIKAE